MKAQWKRDSRAFPWNRDGTMTRETANLQRAADHRGNCIDREWMGIRKRQYLCHIEYGDSPHSSMCSARQIEAWRTAL